MNELIKVDADAQVVSARELHEALGVEKRFSAWFETNSQGFVEGEDFTSVLSGTVVNNGAHRELQDYNLSVDMAKHICLMSRTDKEADSNSNYGASSATGYKGASSATGDYGASSATGNCGASSATGYCGASSADDRHSIAVAWGYHGKAKGVIGSYLVLADWEGDEDNYWTQELWSLKGAKMVRVDGTNIKANTWYTMKNGEIVECEED